MQLETVNCGNCGAPLQIPDTANFVTCNHCKSSLAVKRMTSITLTETMERTEERLEKAESHLAHLVHQNRIEQERRRWERERERHMIKDKYGNKHVPSEGGAIFILILMVVMSLFFFASPVPAIGLFPILIGFAAMAYTTSKAKDYKTAYRAHLSRLSQIPSPDTMLADDSHHTFLNDLEHAPTPSDFLRELAETERQS